LEGVSLNVSRPGEFYQHSGRFSLSGLALCVAAGGAAASLGGAACGWFWTWGRQPALGFIAFVVLALWTAFAAGWATRLGKLRSVKAAALAGAAVGAAAVWASWAAWLSFALGGEAPGPGPMALLGAAAGFARETASDPGGGPVLAWILGAMWLGEAATLLFAGLVGGALGVAGEAFDEESGEWASESLETTLAGLLDDDIQGLLEMLHGGAQDALLGLRRVGAGAAFRSELRLRWNPSGTFFAASLQNVEEGRDGRGRPRRSVSAIATNYVVDARTFEALKAKAAAPPDC
jgi:hypothetical protein